MTALEPTNRPAPMTPPSEIIVMCRDFRDFCSSGAFSAMRGAYPQGESLSLTTAVTATFGVTSMTAPLRRVLVRRPATSGDWHGAGWRVPDGAALARQHEDFCALLDRLG